jgi:alditol oxidase
MAAIDDSPANWAGNVRFAASLVQYPASIGELQKLVAGARRVRALGTGHSFSPLADTTGALVSTAGLPPVIDIDTGRQRVAVSSGLRYSDIAIRLHTAGLALQNLASLPHISVAGATATATHGSGDAQGCLSTAVSALELVTATGDVVTLTRDDEQAPLDGAVVALGALGIVTRLTLDTVPAFTVRQYAYQGIPFEQVALHFDEITASGYSVSLFTDWRAGAFTQTWLKLTGDAAPPAAAWLGGHLASRQLHPVAGLPAANCTVQLGVPGPWHERLPHFRPEFTPSAGAELQSEFLVAREHAVAVLGELAAMATDLAPVTLVSEIRTVAGDTLWLSPSYHRDSAAFHFTWVPDERAVRPVLRRVEAVLAPYAPRPHWGKIFASPPHAVLPLYPRMDDFRRLAGSLDPAGKFCNPMLQPYLRQARSGPPARGASM